MKGQGGQADPRHLASAGRRTPLPALAVARLVQGACLCVLWFAAVCTVSAQGQAALVEVSLDGGTYRVRASAQLTADQKVAWETLTDYDAQFELARPLPAVIGSLFGVAAVRRTMREQFEAMLREIDRRQALLAAAERSR
jgi:hypothetical protein